MFFKKVKLIKEEKKVKTNNISYNFVNTKTKNKKINRKESNNDSPIAKMSKKKSKPVNKSPQNNHSNEIGFDSDENTNTKSKELSANAYIEQDYD